MSKKRAGSTPFSIADLSGKYLAVNMISDAAPSVDSNAVFHFVQYSCAHPYHSARGGVWLGIFSMILVLQRLIRKYWPSSSSGSLSMEICSYSMRNSGYLGWENEVTLETTTLAREAGAEDIGRCGSENDNGRRKSGVLLDMHIHVL